MMSIHLRRSQAKPPAAPSSDTVRCTLASLLDDRFAVLTRAPRSALTHHQTLRAMMDWSYDLLPASEQAVLRRLAVFQGDFTIDGAVAIAMDAATVAQYEPPISTHASQEMGMVRSLNRLARPMHNMAIVTSWI